MLCEGSGPVKARLGLPGRGVRGCLLLCPTQNILENIQIVKRTGPFSVCNWTIPIDEKVPTVPAESCPCSPSRHRTHSVGLGVVGNPAPRGGAPRAFACPLTIGEVGLRAPCCVGSVKTRAGGLAASEREQGHDGGGKGRGRKDRGK